MRLTFNPKLYSAVAVVAVALVYGIWVEPLALSQEEPSESSAPADKSETPPEDSVVVRDGATSTQGEVKSSQEKDDLEVIDLNEPLDEQVEKWDSAKARYNSPATSVTIENIVEPTGEYRYASFGKPNPFMPPLKLIEEGAGPDGDMNPASDLAMAGITAAVNTPPGDATAEKGVDGVSGRSQEIPVVSTLQKYPLANLELKGVWQLDNGEKRAIVMTPNKEGIIVKASDPISAGKVLEINRDHLVVRQYRLREDGVREFADQNLYLGDAVRKEKTYVRLVPGKDPEFTPEQTNKESVPKATGIVKQGPATNIANPTPNGAVDTTPVPVETMPAVNTPASAPIPVVPAATNDGPLNQAVPVPFGTAAPTTPASTTGSSQP